MYIKCVLYINPLFLSVGSLASPSSLGALSEVLEHDCPALYFSRSQDYALIDRDLNHEQDSIPARTTPGSARSMSGVKEPGQLDEKWPIVYDHLFVLSFTI